MGLWDTIKGTGAGFVDAFGNAFGGKTYTPDQNAARLEHGAEDRRRALSVYDRSYAGRDVPGLRGLQSQLGAVAAGQAPGAGELAARRMGSRAIGQVGSQAMGARGFGAAGVAANANRQIADIGTQTAGMAAESALQDQAQARNALLSSMEVELRARGLDDAQIAEALSRMSALDLAELDARIRQEGYRAAEAAADPGFGPAMLQTIGGILPAVI